MFSSKKNLLLKFFIVFSFAQCLKIPSEIHFKAPWPLLWGTVAPGVVGVGGVDIWYFRTIRFDSLGGGYTADARSALAAASGGDEAAQLQALLQTPAVRQAPG